MEIIIKYFGILFENELDEKIINEEETLNKKDKKELNILNNNNDAFNFIFLLISYLKLFLYSLYDCFISYSKYTRYFLYQLQIIFFTITIILELVLSLDTSSNSDISTNLIISAYFRNKNYTRITYEEILKNGNKKYKEIDKISPIYENRTNIFTIDKILISIICFVALFLIIQFSVKSRIKNFICFNIVGIYATHHLTKYFYKDRNYFSSSFMFVLFIFFDKNLLDAFYIKLRFQRKDFEIFSRNLISNNITQFILKFLSLLNITFFSLFFSLLYYSFWLNFFLDYLCILAFLSFLGNCLEQTAPYYLKPFKNIILFFVGVLNIIFSKLFLKKKIFKQNNNDDFHSLYLINDLFSAYCINFINNYFEYQYKYVLDINNINNQNNVNNHYILCKNSVWFGFIFISIFFGFLGIITQEFIPFIISLYITKKIINYFSQLYNIKLSRIVNNIIICNFFSFIPIVSKLNDFYFLSLLKNITNLSEEILYFSLEFIFLLLIIYYIINTNFMLYLGYNEYQSKHTEDETNSAKLIDILYIIFEILIQFLIMYLITILYKNQEKKLIINLLNVFSIVIYHLLKIPSLNELKRNQEENINYNIYIFIWVIISLILIELSGPEISLLYVVNHVNLIFFINFFILNDRNNNIFKIIVIFFLLVDYYRLHSCLFIIDAIAIIIYPTIRNLKSKKNDNHYNSNERYRINLESIKAYNKLTFSFALFLLLFSLLEIG